MRGTHAQEISHAQGTRGHTHKGEHTQKGIHTWYACKGANYPLHVLLTGGLSGNHNTKHMLWQRPLRQRVQTHTHARMHTYEHEYMHTHLPSACAHTHTHIRTHMHTHTPSISACSTMACMLSARSIDCTKLMRACVWGQSAGAQVRGAIAHALGIRPHLAQFGCCLEACITTTILVMCSPCTGVRASLA